MVELYIERDLIIGIKLLHLHVNTLIKGLISITIHD